MSYAIRWLRQSASCAKRFQTPVTWFDTILRYEGCQPMSSLEQLQTRCLLMRHGQPWGRIKYRVPQGVQPERRTTFHPEMVPLASAACSSAIWRCRVFSTRLRYSSASSAAASKLNVFCCCCCGSPCMPGYCGGRVPDAKVNIGPS